MKNLLNFIIKMATLVLIITSIAFAIKYMNIRRINYHGIIYADNTYFAYGSDINYNIIIKSNDGKNWKEIYPSGFMWSLLPIESNYTLNTNNRVIWTYERENCSECDQTLYGIYYSHDLGKTWNNISLNYPDSSMFMLTYIEFHGENYAELNDVMIYKEGADIEYSSFHSLDGGKSWNFGRLDKKFKVDYEPPLDIELDRESCFNNKEDYCKANYGNPNNILEIPRIYQKLDLSFF